MRIRVVRCPEDAHDLPWVNASECEHWSMDCPRAKKAKKPHHKLKGGEPGFDVLLVKADHEYRLPPNSQEDWVPQEQRLMREGWQFNQLPSAMRYSDCECGLPWSFHQPSHEGPARYMGRWSPRGLRLAQKGLLIHCATDCGLEAAE